MILLRIIDKNTDFYDYIQNIYRDDSVTFDRTDSFLLTKEMFCDCLGSVGNRYRYSSWNDIEGDYYALLQVGNAFWLFYIEVTEWGGTYKDKPKAYTIDLLATWKNYDKERKLVSLDIVSFGYSVNKLYYKYRDNGATRKASTQKAVNNFINAINTNDYKVEDSLNKKIIYNGDGTKIEKHIPILKACGISSCVDPMEIYLAFDEYFSLEKQSTERIASLGITDKEKIENHGFDTKISFRGKK